MVGAAGAAVSLWQSPGAVAGPFGAEDFDKFPIPADKKLDPAWVASLTARGTPTVYRSERGELMHIGMPIGGVCCGQVYLGGDGSLWHWDIFNLPQAGEWSHSSGPLYAKPARPASPINQGFSIRVTKDGRSVERRLDSSGFAGIEFRGQYPIGLVNYADEEFPARVELEAFSPFCPLDEERSGTPTIVLNYTVTNTSDRPIEATIAGWLENAVCRATGRGRSGVRTTRIVREEHAGSRSLGIECSARASVFDAAPLKDARPDIVFEDWERGSYDGWRTTGDAFGDRPRNRADIARYQGDLAQQGEWTVNTHESRHGEDVRAADAHIGTLTSRAFKIERHFIGFRIGGGRHPGQTCVNLLIDGAVVRTATGANSNRMRLENFDVREFGGRDATLQIVDGWTGEWGNIGCDEIVFSDVARAEPYSVENAPDYGSMSLSVLGSEREVDGAAWGGESWRSCLEEPPQGAESGDAPISEAGPTGWVRRRPFVLAPGESRVVTFAIAWWFPNVDREQLSFLTGSGSLRRWYAGKYENAGAVRAELIANLDRLAGTTRLWRDTWYDSTLPHWFLDRTFATVTTASTATCWRFDNGRFYGWEGTYCCAGTCMHVWHYGQALARVFPALERSTREIVDFGLAFHDDSGQIDYRAEADRELAVDGQCGTILRAYREHLMSTDDRFLRRVWPRVKKAIECMIARDPDENGILDGPQYNTLDTTWYGKISWLTSMYLGAVRAGEAMAREMDNAGFAERCAAITRRGSAAMLDQLFNGEYFVHKTDAAHPEANSTGEGCHIDQLLGQSWMHQVGLGRIVPREQSRSALGSLYRYSFTPDIGPYRKFADSIIKGGRWYAMPGEGGLLMCTWPKGGAEAATGKGDGAWAAGYFNECMSGFEHQVASHMIAEGLVTEGLAITRAIHDRYHARLRNPWNEVECGNHYARAMAGYGSFVTMCGFEHHGPRGVLAFAPRLAPDDFACAFIAAGAWGRFLQRRTEVGHRLELDVRWGSLALSRLGVELREGWSPRSTVVKLGDNAVAHVLKSEGGRAWIEFGESLKIGAGMGLGIELSA